jgi:hypothetical protein
VQPKRRSRRLTFKRRPVSSHVMIKDGTRSEERIAFRNAIHVPTRDLPGNRALRVTKESV